MPDEKREPSRAPTLYKGLEPFTEKDAEFFFGRNEERDRLVYSLQSSRLTILYGAKQVGKTSLLRAGVAHQLRQISCKQSVDLPESAVVVFDDWSGPDVLEKLSIAIDGELERVGVARADRPGFQNLSFIERCQAWTGRLGDDGGELFILLDQFDDYLLQYPYASTDPAGFDFQFSKAVSTRGLAVNFLIAIRDDLLASLDRYRATIGNLYDSLIRLEALNKKQALGALQGPVYNAYNPQHENNKIGIETELARAVLDSINLDRGTNIPGVIGPQTASESRFDAAGLQLAMKAVWEREWETSDGNPQALRQEVFGKELGGIFGISDRYVEERVQRLAWRQRCLGARVFDHLITPGGMGVAYPLGDLAGKVGSTEEELQELMKKLEDAGILVAAAHGGSPGSVCYEIANRILTPAILARVRNYFEERAAEEKRLGAEIERSLRLFYEKSELDGLKTIIDAGEDWTEEVSNLFISDELRDDLRKALQRILDNLAQKAQFGGYKGAVSSVAFSRDGKVLVTGAEDGSVRLWNIGSPGQEPLIYPDRHKTWIWALRTSPDGKWLASGSDDGTAALWALTNQGLEFRYFVPLPTQAGTSPLVRGLSFNPREPLLAIATTDGQVRLWHMDEEKVLVNFTASHRAVRCVEFSPDGLSLATGADDGTIGLWDLQGNCLGGCCSPGGSKFRHHSAVWKIRFHPDGKRLASCSEDHTIKLWNLDGGEEEQTLIGHTCWVLGLRFNSDGSLLASASEDGTARLWDEKGNQVASFIHGAPVNGVCFSPDDLTLATAAADCRVRLWNVSQGSESRRPKQYRHPGKAILFDVSFSSDGKYLATGASDNEAQVWDKKGNLERRLVGHKSWIMCAVFHPNGPYLATGSIDGTARVWNVDDGANVEFAGHRGPVWSVAFSPDGNFLATGSGDGLIRLWDRREPQADPIAAYTSNHGPVWSIRFSPGGEWIAAGCQDGVIQICNLKGEEVMKLDGIHEGQVLSLSFSPNGKLLASSSSEGRICLWDLATQEFTRFPRLNAPVWSITFSPDGKTLASGSVDRTVSLWNLKGERLGGFTAEGPIRGLSFSRPDGKWLAAACSDGTVRLWPTWGEENVESLLASAKSEWEKASPLIYGDPESP